MRLTNTPTEVTVLRLEQRKSFSVAVIFTDGAGGRVDITGAVLTLDRLVNLARLDHLDALVAGDVASTTAVLVDPVYGYARFDVQAAELDLVPGSYPFSVTLRTDDRYSVVVVKGVLELQFNPEFVSAEHEYTSGSPATDLEVCLRGMNVVDVTVGSVLPPGAQYLTDEDKAKLDLLHPQDGGVVVDLTGYATVTYVDAATTVLQAGISAVQAEVDETELDIAALLNRLNAADARLAAGFTTMTGEMRMWAGATAPPGWLLCQGQIVARADYPELFAVVGTRFVGGASPTSAQFRLPSMNQRVPVGVDTNFLLGSYGGAAVHTLTVAEMPTHSHTQNAHNHTQNAHAHLTGISNSVAYAAGSPGGNTAQVSHSPSVSYTSDVTATNIAATATNQNNGGNGAHNNMQPYTSVNFIIKT